MKRNHPRIARLSIRLTLQEPQATEDELGGRSVSWNTRTTLWGGIEPLMGREAADGLWHDQPAGRLRARIWLRRRTDVTPAPGMRLVEATTGRAWHIETVADPDGARRYWLCLCEARPL